MFPLALLAMLAADPAVMISSDQLPRLKAAARRNPAVRRLADRALKAGPWSVTGHRPAIQDLDPHEYYSEGPYWWPDPKNPNGPYIRRDGERNPERFIANRRDLSDMSNAVLALGMGACLLEDPRYAARANTVLSTWFVDPATRMNPNLEHGQAVRGRNTGRGAGIIDTVALIYAVQGIVLLERAGGLDWKVAAGLREWFAEYLKWMTTSAKGGEEEKAKNNHGTWWTAQVAAFSTYLNEDGAAGRAFERYRTVLVPGQIGPDGSCPLEEARTRSLSYSAFNLDAFSVIARIAQVRGENLWPALAKAVDYLLPFALEPATWKKQQIEPYERDRPVFLALAGMGLGDRRLLAAHRTLPRAESPWVVLVELMLDSQ
jgi:hypothetical protein